VIPKNQRLAFGIPETPENAPGRRRLVDHDLAESGAVGLQLPPEPGGHVLDRRVLQPINLIEVGMVEHTDERIHRPADPSVIIDPTYGGIYLTLHRDLDHETVAMHIISTLVPLRQIWESLRGLETEFFDQLCPHGRLGWAIRRTDPNPSNQRAPASPPR